MRFILPLALTILLIGCGTTTNYYTKTVHSWKGSSLNKLTKRWGRPDIAKTGPRGDKVYIYKVANYQRFNTAGPQTASVHFPKNGRPVIIVTDTGRGTWNRDMSISCTVFFVANRKSIITETKTVGNGCYGGANFAKRMGNGR